jgi:hypothetical protein
MRWSDEKRTLAMTESISLTFAHKDHLQSPLVDATGAVHYTTATTTGIRGNKVTTITAASVVGEIDWRKKTFALGGVRRGWDALRSDVGAASGGCVSDIFLNAARSRQD